jgi:hypothetical protein
MLHHAAERTLQHPGLHPFAIWPFRDFIIKIDRRGSSGMWSSRTFLYLSDSDPEHDSLAGDLMSFVVFEPFYSEERYDQFCVIASPLKLLLGNYRSSGGLR